MMWPWRLVLFFFLPSPLSTINYLNYIQIAINHNSTAGVRRPLTFWDKVNLAHESYIHTNCAEESLLNIWKMKIARQLFDCVDRSKLRQHDPFLQIAMWPDELIKLLARARERMLNPSKDEESKTPRKTVTSSTSSTDIEDRITSQMAKEPHTSLVYFPSS
jgi:hypothetical protein